MFQYSQTKFSSSIKQGGLPIDTTFSDLKVAISLSSPESEVRKFIQKYAKLEARFIAQVDRGQPLEIQLSMYKCELNEDGDLEDFYPVASYQKDYHEGIKDTYQCIDFKGGRLLGNQFTPTYSILSISFGVDSSLCSGKYDTCELSDRNESLLRQITVTSLINSQRFDKDEYQTDPIIRQSVLSQHPVFQIPTAVAYDVGFMKVDRQDNALMEIPGVTKYHDEVYTIEKAEPRFLVAPQRGDRLEFSF